MEHILNAGNGNQPASGLIKDSDQQSFAADVIEESMRQPVIVDFWAEWCGPCKQLGPQLEKAVSKAGGAVKMVKIDIDKNQSLAGQLRIQSIPTVYAFFQGQPVDGFQGAQPESEIAAFIDRLTKMSGAEVPENPIDQALEQAQALIEAEDFAPASALLQQVLQHEPDNRPALAGLLACYLGGGDLEGARQMADGLENDVREDAAFASVLARLEVAERAAEAGPLNELMAMVDANSGDHQARIDLANALEAAGQSDAAAEALLEIIRRDRAWNDEAARKQLVKLFEAWGPTDPRTLEFRRRLSSILFS